MDNAREKLKEKGIAATLQRLAILKCLEAHKGEHPSADTLFQHIQNEYPVLSRATVYNTLQAFAEAGIVNELRIEKEKSRYDLDTNSHHHFLCRRCGKVFDIDPCVEHDCPVLTNKFVNGHKVEMLMGYLYGVCETCQKKEDKA